MLVRNHEIWVTCPFCGFEYDTLVSWDVCPNCGKKTTSDDEH